MWDDIRYDVEPWTNQEKAALLLRILKRDISIGRAANDRHLPATEIEAWKEELLATAEEAVRSGSAQEMRVEAQAARELRGVWICAKGRESLAPCLFMEAACNGQLALSPVARWIRAGDPPRQQIRRSEQLSLLHGLCNLGAPESEPLHMFASKAGSAFPFERYTDLMDWELPIPLAAVILLLDRQEDDGPLSQVVSKLADREDCTLAWIARQTLPIVVAAMGFAPGEFLGGRLHRRYGLQPDVPLVMGESPARSRLQASDRSSAIGRLLLGSLASFLGVGDVSFDPEYARRIVNVLRTKIGQEGEMD